MNINIPYKPHDYQERFHADECRFRIVVGGRRVGKSLSFLHELIRHSIETPNRFAYWVSPTYNSAKEIGFDEFLKYQYILEPAIHTIHHTRLKVVFKNGSMIYFKGSDNPDTLRGRGLSLAVLDEAAFIKKDVWTKIIRPALSDRKGRAVFGSTPNGFNWFKDLYDKKDKSTSKYVWITELNPLITEEELNQVKADISLDEYRQEYLAKFVTKAGRVYDNFTGENILPPSKIVTDKNDIYLGMDFGFAHHTAVVFMAVNRISGTVLQFDELYVNKTQIDDIIKQINTKLGNHGLRQADVKACFSDPAGNAEELSSGLSPVDMMRNKGFNVVNKGSSVNAGIALVRSYIKNTLGKIRYYVTDNNTETIKCYNGYQYNIDKSGGIKEEPLKDNIFDHIMDAVRYFFINVFDHAKFVAKEPTTWSYTNKESKIPRTRVCDSCHRTFITRVNNKHVCDTCIETEEQEQSNAI